jgi:NADH:ubiquinone oxidoreductase subunit E
MPEEQPSLFLCMGSACHQMGVYQVLPQVQALLEEHGLRDKVQLKGGFCMGPCEEGIVMKFGSTLFTRISPENIRTRFEQEILPALNAEVAG